MSNDYLVHKGILVIDIQGIKIITLGRGRSKLRVIKVVRRKILMVFFFQTPVMWNKIVAGVKVI